MGDILTNALEQLEKILLNQAIAAGEDPQSMLKSKFRSEMERQSFISAYGQEAYDNLHE